MKFLIVGLGSMGKRRTRNLFHLNEKNIIGFDTRKDRCDEISKKYKIQTFNLFDDALNENPDAMIISTPPDLHMSYAKIALKNNIHFFTEASVVSDDMIQVIKQLNNSKIVGMPSCTMRYHPLVAKIKEILTKDEIGKPLSFFYNSGQYLPDWHPWEDYREFYVSNKETGGCKEIVTFELVWITDVFGQISSVLSDKGKISSLKADIDDIYFSLLEFKTGVKGVMSVDVINRVPIRQLKILTENATIFADWYEKSLKYFIAGDGWHTMEIDDGIAEENYIHSEKMYIEEMRTFIELIEKKLHLSYTFEDDLGILQILEAIEKSSELGIKQQISNNS